MSSQSRISSSSLGSSKWVLFSMSGSGFMYKFCWEAFSRRCVFSSAAPWSLSFSTFVYPWLLPTAFMLSSYWAEFIDFGVAATGWSKSCLRRSITSSLSTFACFWVSCLDISLSSLLLSRGVRSSKCWSIPNIYYVSTLGIYKFLNGFTGSLICAGQLSGELLSFY